jgi:TPP-dependent pyruvate/acetoin dehydrogenase alpha subunit
VSEKQKVNIEIDPDLLEHMFRVMVTIRLFEQEALKWNSKKKIPGFLHSYIGEEASAAGICLSLNPNDYIVSNHRGHGHLIAKGCSLSPMMAELFGRVTGFCRGKGGSMHIADFSSGILGANGIVGAGLPISVGAGLACKLEAQGRIVVCFFGDGASNQGSFHESINMASVLELPVVFVCENNQYAVSTPFHYHQKVSSVADRACAYCIKGTSVDGNDVLAVFRAASKAVEEARAGAGPYILETKTYRWYGHCEADPPDIYRSREEVDEWKSKCPIKRFKSYLIEKDVFTVDYLDRIEGEVNRQISEAVDFAQNSPEPELEDALKDIYYERNDR